VEHVGFLREQAMHCVAYGGIDIEMRTESLEYLTSLSCDGYDISGSLGNGQSELQTLLTRLMPFFDNLTKESRSKPRHILGIADEESIRNAAMLGVDTMDSCYPTRLGRHETLLGEEEEKIKIKRGCLGGCFGRRWWRGASLGFVGGMIGVISLGICGGGVVCVCVCVWDEICLVLHSFLYYTYGHSCNIYLSNYPLTTFHQCI